MTQLKNNLSAPATYAVAASLAAALYDVTGTIYNTTTNAPQDVLFEYVAQVAANPTGVIYLFVQGSTDSTKWPPTPSSNSDTTHDTSMRPLGTIAANNGASSAGVNAGDTFSIAAAFGYLPAYFRVFVKNGTGVALSNCAARTQELSLTAV